MEESLENQIAGNPSEHSIEQIIQIEVGKYDPNISRLGGVMEGDGDCT